MVLSFGFTIACFLRIKFAYREIFRRRTYRSTSDVVMVERVRVVISSMAGSSSSPVTSTINFLKGRGVSSPGCFRFGEDNEEEDILELGLF